MHRILQIFLLFTILSSTVFAQDTLPAVSVTKMGRKVLVSWINPYTNIADINIQRSADSLKGFTTIGSVINVDAKANGFLDPKEFLPNDQYYRLFISFKGGSYLFTTARRAIDDTTAADIVIDNPIQAQPSGKSWFIPSRHVYTGKDNNVIISLRDAEKQQYSIRFFEDDGTFLFELNKINQPYLILDKVNFIHTGLFKFELFNHRQIVERHKFFIPKDGRPMPALDINGYEINR